MIQNSNAKLACFIAWQDNKPVHILSIVKSGIRECNRRIQNKHNKTYNSTMGATTLSINDYLITDQE